MGRGPFWLHFLPTKRTTCCHGTRSIFELPTYGRLADTSASHSALRSFASRAVPTITTLSPKLGVDSFLNRRWRVTWLAWIYPRGHVITWLLRGSRAGWHKAYLSLLALLTEVSLWQASCAAAGGTIGHSEKAHTFKWTLNRLLVCVRERACVSLQAPFPITPNIQKCSKQSCSRSDVVWPWPTSATTKPKSSSS